MVSLVNVVTLTLTISHQGRGDQVSRRPQPFPTEGTIAKRSNLIIKGELMGFKIRRRAPPACLLRLHASPSLSEGEVR